MTSDQPAAGPARGRRYVEPPETWDVVDRPAPLDGGDAELPRPPRPWYRQVFTQWPLFVSLAVVAGGVAVAGAGQWRWGATIAGAGVVLATVLRLLLPERVAGLLCCRRRSLDVLVTGVLGVGILIVTWIVSPDRH